MKLNNTHEKLYFCNCGLDCNNPVRYSFLPGLLARLGSVLTINKKETYAR